MQKVLINYFSQGGTTQKISKEIGLGLKSGHCKVEFNNIAENKTVDINAYDAIGIGFPVYIFRIPFIMHDFIKSLPDLKGKPFFVFILYGSLTGNAGTVARKMLAYKGGREIGYSKFRGCGIFLGYLQRGYLSSPDHPSKVDLKEAESFGKKLVPLIANSNYNAPEFDSLPGPVYSIERMITLNFFVKYFYRFFFNVNKKKCTQCEICISCCSVNNITVTKKGYPKWNNACLFCWFCEMKCPENAIKSPIDWPIMKPFMIYNVSQARKNPANEGIQVKLEKGKIIRLN